MRKQNIFDVIYTHTEGEPLCIIHSGIPYPTGSTILEKRKFLTQNYDWLRCALMPEPRGDKDMYGVFLTPPSSEEYEAGVICMEATEYSHWCGQGTIAVAMAMVALGLIQGGRGDRPIIRFKATAGLVVAEVASDGDRVEWTRFENVPAYVAEQDVVLDLPELGPLKAHIVWGGNYFGIVDVSATALRISPENGALLSRLGVQVREQLRSRVTLHHPLSAHINDLNYITLWHQPTIAGALYKNVHVFSAGQLDRSPGGTGTSAMMAMLEAPGRLSMNQLIRSEGLLGSGTFEGCLLCEPKLGAVRAVRPTIKGTASILGTARWVIDRDDLVGAGFLGR